MVNAPSSRIAELKGTVVDEMARAEAARDEFQRVRARLTIIGKKVRDRVFGILADATMLIDAVMEVVQNPIYEGIEEETFEEDPEEEVPPNSPAEY